jgi:ribosomal protein S27AE
MAPTIQRKVLKFYREGKQHVDDYLAGVEHGDLKNLGALCSNWSAVVFALATLIALYALGLYRKGLMTTWKMFLSTTAIVALLFCLTVFGYVTGHCMKTMDALESRARGAGQNVGEPRVKVCGQCDAPFANQHTNPAGNRWICASCGMISRKPKLATKETLAGKAKTEECHARSSLDRSPATEAATKEAEERRQVAKQTKELRRRHAREVKEAREAADRADREEIARLVEEERSRKEAARAEEALERFNVEEEQRRLREEEERSRRAR